MSEPDRSTINPDLPDNECRITVAFDINNQLAPTAMRSHCRAPVVDPVWQLCERHNAARQRLLAAEVH